MATYRNEKGQTVDENGRPIGNSPPPSTSGGGNRTNNARSKERNQRQRERHKERMADRRENRQERRDERRDKRKDTPGDSKTPAREIAKPGSLVQEQYWQDNPEALTNELLASAGANLNAPTPFADFLADQAAADYAAYQQQLPQHPQWSNLNDYYAATYGPNQFTAPPLRPGQIDRRRERISNIDNRGKRKDARRELKRDIRAGQRVERQIQAPAPVYANPALGQSAPPVGGNPFTGAKGTTNPFTGSQLAPNAPAQPGVLNASQQAPGLNAAKKGKGKGNKGKKRPNQGPPPTRPDFVGAQAMLSDKTRAFLSQPYQLRGEDSPTQPVRWSVF